MSHHFKKPLSLAEVEIARWARRIETIAMLERVVVKARPQLRRQVFERIRPFLPFKVSAEEVPCLTNKLDGGELYRRFLAAETPEQIAESLKLPVDVILESLHLTEERMRQEEIAEIREQADGNCHGGLRS